MKTTRVLLTLGCFTGLSVLSSGPHAELAGTVLFAQEGAQIVGPSGVARAAKQGDAVQFGERLVTSSGAISQIKLADGSLVGVRPGSELKLDSPASPSQFGQSMSLVQGRVRIIGAELMDKTKSSALTLQTGQATLQLHGADVESLVVKGEARAGAAGGMGKGNPGDANRPPPGGPASGDGGSYSRLAAGTGSLRSGGHVGPLAAGQVNFVSSGNPTPMTMAAMPPQPRGDMPNAPRPPAGTVALAGGAKPPIQPGMAGGPSGLPALSQTTSTLTAPRLGNQGPALGPPMPGGPAPAFSPNQPKLGQGPSQMPMPGLGLGAMPGPNLSGMGPGGPGAMIPRPPIMQRPPVICTPNPTQGKPPICK